MGGPCPCHPSSHGGGQKCLLRFAISRLAGFSCPEGRERQKARRSGAVRTGFKGGLLGRRRLPPAGRPKTASTQDLSSFYKTEASEAPGGGAGQAGASRLVGVRPGRRMD